AGRRRRGESALPPRAATPSWPWSTPMPNRPPTIRIPMSWMSARPSALRPLPAIEDVGCLLFVVRAVGEADGAKAARLVEAARPLVGLEAPELERLHAAVLGGLEQQRTGTAADAVRAGVEQADDLPA